MLVIDQLTQYRSVISQKGNPFQETVFISELRLPVSSDLLHPDLPDLKIELVPDNPLLFEVVHRFSFLSIIFCFIAIRYRSCCLQNLCSIVKSIN